MMTDVIGHEGHALRRIGIDHGNAERTKPVESTLEIAALADNHRAESELASETAVIVKSR